MKFPYDDAEGKITPEKKQGKKTPPWNCRFNKSLQKCTAESNLVNREKEELSKINPTFSQKYFLGYLK